LPATPIPRHNRVADPATHHYRTNPVLKLVLPKGSLERATLDLFEAADLAVNRSSNVDYRAAIGDPRVDEVLILRPQEIPVYVADGLFDLGITGRDWIEETGADVVSLGQLHYSKATARPIRMVLAVADDAPYQAVSDLPQGVRVSTEYVGLTRRFFEGHGIAADVSLSYGATEAKIPDIADAVVEITETGRALRAAGLRILDTILVSFTELIANKASYDDPEKRHAMHQLLTLLSGTLEARGRVLVKLNVAEGDLDGVLKLLPAMKSPTISQLSGNGGFAVETVVPKGEINVLIPALKDAGASDIIELPISKIVH
jgi:ATP phosphoribosyltransferase